MGVPSTTSFPVTDDQAAAIGRVAVNWSLVEAHVSFIIHDLLDLPSSPSHAVTAELGMVHRIYLAETLIGLTGNVTWIGEWAKIGKVMDKLRNQRNDVIHAEWRSFGPEDLEGIRIKARGRVSITLSRTPIAQLQKLAKDIAVLEDRLARYAYTLTVGEARKIIASPDPPGPPPSPAPARKKDAPSQAHVRALERDEIKVRRVKAELREWRRRGSKK